MIERLKVFLAYQLLWKRFPNLMNRQIQSFATTEYTTSWHFLYALRHARDARHKAQLFDQLLEEYHHADLFLDIAQKRSTSPVYIDRGEIRSLYPRQDLWKLIVYAQKGEDDAVVRFNELLRQVEDEPLRRALKEVLADEKGHAEHVMDISHEMGASPVDIERQMRKVKLARLWQDWSMSGRRILGFPSKIMLYGVYFLIGALLVWPSRKRLSHSPLRADVMKRALS